MHCNLAGYDEIKLGEDIIFQTSDLTFKLNCDTKNFNRQLKKAKRKLFKTKLKTLIKGILNMFKTKNTKRIEELQEIIEMLNNKQKMIHKRITQNEKDICRYGDNTKEENKKLQQQIECGITHKTESCIHNELGHCFNLVPQYEVCKTCGKKLRKFNNSIDADRRKAELLEIEAKKIKDSCDKLEKELEEQGK